MMVIRVKVQVMLENRPNFLATMKESIAISSKFDGCLAFGLYEDVTDENTLLLYEEWDTQNNFDAYRKSEHFAESGKVLFPLMHGEPDSAYFSSERVPTS